MLRLVLVVVIVGILAYYLSLLWKRRARSTPSWMSPHLSKRHVPKITSSFRKSIHEMGIPFLSLIADLFSPSEFHILSPRALDQSGYTGVHPDFLARHIPSGKMLAVVCRHIHYMPSGLAELEEVGSLAQYEEYARQVGIPLYVVLGVGGEGYRPSQLYVMSIEEYCDALERAAKAHDLSRHLKEPTVPFTLDDGMLR